MTTRPSITIGAVLTQIAGWSSGAVHFIGAVLTQIAVWSFSAFYLPLMGIACWLSSPRMRPSRGPKWARGWGRSTCYIAGVKVRFTAAARAALSQRRPRVMTFNHGSTLDVLVGASLLPDGGVFIVKEEFRRLPFLGFACVAMGSIFLDRGDRDRAYASLQAAAERIRTEQLQVLIAPEGTRSEDGSLGRFKLGAFHLSHIAEAPVLPVVMHGNAATWPASQFVPTRGSVVVDVLPEFNLGDGDPEVLRAAADGLRDRYLEALAAGPSD